MLLSVDRLTVRFTKVGKEPGLLFLWVGVMPRCDAKAVAIGCKQILAVSQFTDVEITF